MNATITLAELARELDLEQGPRQPYGPADLFASADHTLEATYGDLRDDTEIAAADADALRALFAGEISDDTVAAMLDEAASAGDAAAVALCAIALGRAEAYADTLPDELASFAGWTAAEAREAVADMIAANR